MGAHKALLSLSAWCVHLFQPSWGQHQEREADVKGLVKALGHSGLCWVVEAEHAGVEITDLKCGGAQLWNPFKNGMIISN